MTASTLQDLLDRAGIDDAINAYSHALDQREWALLEEAFAPDARIVLIDRDTVHSPATLVTALSRNDATRLGGQHLVGKTRARITGDTAHAVTEAHWTTLQTTADPERFLLVRGTGIYRDELVRGEAGWRIADRELALKSITRDHIGLEGADLDAIRCTLAQSRL
ncbi:MAG TPA: nuclear transport factor 2 family protein [Candidatus Brachybacterium merdigallinarum]|nr:nuclear transport factor 2 family protein [Candidatus Brachybacterium merdigallinarum]